MNVASQARPPPEGPRLGRPLLFPHHLLQLVGFQLALVHDGEVGANDGDGHGEDEDAEQDDEGRNDLAGRRVRDEVAVANRHHGHDAPPKGCRDGREERQLVDGMARGRGPSDLVEALARHRARGGAARVDGSQRASGVLLRDPRIGERRGRRPRAHRHGAVVARLDLESLEGVVEDSSLGVVDDAAEDREAQGHQENEHVQGPR